MDVLLKRAYEKPSTADGARVLVDGIWPRGVSKEDLAVDEWCKEIAPTKTLRVWFNHDTEKWPEFRKRYLAQLHEHKSVARELLDRHQGKTLTLVYGAKDEAHNHARVIREYLKKLAH